MNQRQLASVLFAVLGVFVAISWLPQLFLQIGFLARGSADADEYAGTVSIVFLITAIIAILVGILLVMARNALADRLFPSESQPLSSRDTQAVALSVLGCYFVIQGGCRLLSFGEINWSGVTQLVLGLGLFFGARGVARLWTLARTARPSDGGERAV